MYCFCRMICFKALTFSSIFWEKKRMQNLIYNIIGRSDMKRQFCLILQNLYSLGFKQKGFFFVENAKWKNIYITERKKNKEK